MSIILNDDDDFDLIDGKKVLKDGRTLRVRMTLMDREAAHAPLNRPGPRYNTDAAAADRREVSFGGYLKDLSEAWRKPDVAPIVAADDKKPPGETRERALAQRDAHLSDAWRGAAV